MRGIRIYIDRPLETGQQTTIEGESAHYLLNVLRVTEGQTLYLFNGKGGFHAAEIINITKRLLTVNPVKFVADEKESNLNLTLVQGISRGQKMDFTIQKAVELGVKRIVPVMTEFSNCPREK